MPRKFFFFFFFFFFFVRESWLRNMKEDRGRVSSGVITEEMTCGRGLKVWTENLEKDLRLHFEGNCQST